MLLHKNQFLAAAEDGRRAPLAARSSVSLRLNSPFPLSPLLSTTITASHSTKHLLQSHPSNSTCLCSHPTPSAPPLPATLECSPLLELQQSLPLPLLQPLVTPFPLLLMAINSPSASCGLPPSLRPASLPALHPPRRLTDGHQRRGRIMVYASVISDYYVRNISIRYSRNS